MEKNSIITVGISPAWDITCRVDGLSWGDHKQLDSQTVAPAGKALNISRALAWMGKKNTAAGLWGLDDYNRLRQVLTEPLIDLQMTQVPGCTRQNITVIDTRYNRELHLRAPSLLAVPSTLARLATHLQSLIQPGSMVVFSGALPGEDCLEPLRSMFLDLVQNGAKLVLDTSGPHYRHIVSTVPITLIKPNIEELSELCGAAISDSPDEIIKAAAPLCGKVEYIVVSRGGKGAILIHKQQAFSCHTPQSGDKSIHTVGCGDFLLAGLLAHLDSDLEHALAAGVRAAAAKAWGLYPAMPWPQAEQNIVVNTASIPFA